MDITNLLNDYQECARHIWNTFLLKKVSSNCIWNTIEEFDKICTILFNLIVLKPLGHSESNKAFGFEKYPSPLLFIKVIPGTGSQIFINRELKVSGYWDYTSNHDYSKIDLRFIDFFDFDLQSFRHFEYYRVRIVGPPQYSDIIGRDALLKSNEASIEMIQDSDEG